MPRPLYIARHGETAWNAAGRLQGLTDIPLNERGQQQARDLATSLSAHGIRTVITSDLTRARETGAIVAEVLGLAQPRIVPELRERGHGIFEGLTRDEIIERHPEAWRAWDAHRTPPDGAEALAAATARMHAILGTLVAEADDTALIISHGGVMRLWLLDVIGDDVPPLHNAVTYAVSHDGARFSARRLDAIAR